MADLDIPQQKSPLAAHLATHGIEVQSRFLADSMYNNPTALNGKPCDHKPAPWEILTLSANLEKQRLHVQII